MGSERVQVAGIGILSVFMVLAVYSSLSGATFTGDDWHYLALLRHIDSPLDAFTSNMGGAYFYRPVALLIFWISEMVFGANAVAHYCINVAIHVWVAYEVFALASLVTERRPMSAWAATLFLVLPVTAATPLWISDRFDLMVTAAILCSMRLMAIWALSITSSDMYRWASLALALVALGSKEIAFALPAALVLLLTMCKARSLRSRAISGGAVLLVGAITLLGRIVALGGFKGDESLSVNTAAITTGLAVWAARLPSALQTHNGHVALLAVGTAFAVVFFLRRGTLTFGNASNSVCVIVPLLFLAAGIVIAQSPIAGTALPKDDTVIVTVSLRFYYAVLAVFCVLAVWITTRAELTPKIRWVMTATALGAILTGAFGSAQQTAIWTANTAEEAQRASAALLEYSKLAEHAQDNHPCVVRLPTATAVMTDLDLRFKASIVSADPRVNCALMTTPPQVQTITRLRECRSTSMLPTRSSVPGLEPLSRSGTCTFFFLSE